MNTAVTLPPAMDEDTLEQLIDVVRKFVSERLIPLEAQVAEEDNIPEEVVQEMREMGLFGLTIPQAYGGIGLNTYEECRVVMELGRTLSFRSIIGTNNGMGSQGLVMDGTEEQKAFYLPKFASGEIIGSFALTEPDAGSDAGSLTTRAVRDGDDFIINGTKRYITNAPSAQLFTVFARTDQDTAGAKGVSAFLWWMLTPRESRWVHQTARWARKAPTYAMLCLMTAGFPPTVCWGAQTN